MFFFMKLSQDNTEIINPLKPLNNNHVEFVNHLARRMQYLERRHHFMDFVQRALKLLQWR